ncbi:MAG: phosphatase PAP2 family protein [Gemmatimonadota bacterium]
MGILSRRQVPRWVDGSLRIVTHLGGGGLSIAICLSFLAIPTCRHVGVLAALANLLSHFVVQLLKRTVVRSRPSIRLQHVVPLAALPDPWSFPSGHGCAAAAIGMTIALEWPIVTVPVLGLAAIVGASRVYLRIHYPTDVVVGQLIGGITALLVRLMLP